MPFLTLLNEEKIQQRSPYWTAKQNAQNISQNKVQKYPNPEAKRLP